MEEHGRHRKSLEVHLRRRYCVSRKLLSTVPDRQVISGFPVIRSKSASQFGSECKRLFSTVIPESDLESYSSGMIGCPKCSPVPMPTSGSRSAGSYPWSPWAGIRVYPGRGREQSFLIRFPDEPTLTLYLRLVNGGVRRCRCTNSTRQRAPSR